MRIKSLGLKGFLGAILLTVAISPALARSQSEPDYSRNDRGKAYRELPEKQYYKEKSHRKGDKARRHYKDDRREHYRADNDRHHYKKHRRKKHRRDHHRGFDSGPTAFFFGHNHGRRGHDGHRHKHRRGHGHDHGHKHGGHGGWGQVAGGCQEVTKIGWWNGAQAVIGGTGCYDRYGNFNIVPRSRYLVRYIYPY